jgi:hypothetical protein
LTHFVANFVLVSLETRYHFSFEGFSKELRLVFSFKLFNFQGSNVPHHHATA